jgi:hypothetical protein
MRVILSDEEKKGQYTISVDVTRPDEPANPSGLRVAAILLGVANGLMLREVAKEEAKAPPAPKIALPGRDFPRGEVPPAIPR